MSLVGGGGAYLAVQHVLFQGGAADFSDDQRATLIRDPARMKESVLRWMIDKGPDLTSIHAIFWFLLSSLFYVADYDCKLVQ